MISHGKDMKVFSGNANMSLAKDVCRLIGIQVGNAEIGHFSDGEVFASIYESVRGSDVFLIQSTSSPVNDNLMELLIMIDAMKRASAGRVTAVIPATPARTARPRPGTPFLPSWWPICSPLPARTGC